MIQGKYKLSFEDYLADPCPEPSLSRSSISLLLDTPAKARFWHPRLNPDFPKEKDPGKFDEGSAAHNLLFEGGNRIFVIDGFDNYKKDAAKEARDAARETGMIPLLQKAYDTVWAMIEAAMKQIREVTDLGVKDFSSEGEAEMSYIWKEKNGVWCRIRPDWTRNDKALIIDYKSTGTSANPDDFAAHMNRMDYPIQDVFYRRGVHIVEKTKPYFIFVAQENEPPYLCSFFGIDMFNEQMAEEKVAWSINRWRHHLDTGEWPGYPKRIIYSEPKPWDLAAWEIRKRQLEEQAA